MKHIYLISEKQLRDASGIIDDNVASGYIRQAIEESQTQLSSILGAKLYDKVIDAVADQTKRTDILKELLDEYIHPWMVAAVHANIIFPLTFKLKQQGLMTANSQYFQTLSISDAEKVKGHYQGSAESARIRMQEFIDEHKTELGLDCGCGAGSRKPNCAIYFRK